MQRIILSLETPEEQEAIKKLLTTPVSAEPTITSRPYKFTIGGKPGYYQVIDNKWKKLTFSPDRKWVVAGEAPPYILNNLNAIKKKVDAQRASGNLTDGRLPKMRRL